MTEFSFPPRSSFSPSSSSAWVGTCIVGQPDGLYLGSVILLHLTTRAVLGLVWSFSRRHPKNRGLGGNNLVLPAKVPSFG